MQIVHGIIDSHAGGHTAAGAIDIKLNILIGILRLKVQKLGYDQARGGVVNFLGQHDYAVVEKSRKNVIRALSAACLLYYIGY